MIKNINGSASERSSLNVQVLVVENNHTEHHFTYRRAIEYWLLLLGLAIGYGSFWRFPYLVYSCGGGAFLIPFFIFLFIIGIPVFTLETLLGQILRKGPIEIYSQIHKKYFGVGLSQVILQFILSVYYAIILCWSLYFFFQSFISPLPWMPYSEADNDIEKILNLYYFKNEILKQSEGIHEMGSINWDLFICLIITYLFIFICIYNGVETSSKAVYVTATAPFILSFILLFKGLSLDGMEEGLKFLFIPDISRLFQFDVWLKASNQVIYMLGIGYGVNILFATSRKQDENVYVSSFWIPIITAGFGMVCAIVNFSFLGHLSKISGIPINELPIAGTDLSFITYPGLLCKLENSNFWSILFFMMMVSLGLDTQFGANEICAEYLYSGFLNKYTDRKTTTFIICIIGVITGTPFIMNGGFYLFTLVDECASMVTGFVVILLEIYIIMHELGSELIKEINNNATKKTIPEYVFYCLEKILPIYISLLIVLSIIEAPTTSNEYQILWPSILKWLIILIPIVSICYYYFKYKNEENIGRNELIERIIN